MSDSTPSQDDPATDPRPAAEEELTDDELRAAYEDDLKRIRVDDVLIQTVVSLLNLAARRAGLAGADEEEVDFGQVAQAIEATRALLPLVEPLLGREAKQVRDALSQLQVAYARSGASPPPGAAAADRPEQPGAPADPPTGPPRSSGRLWVPGQ